MRIPNKPHILSIKVQDDKAFIELRCPHCGNKGGLIVNPECVIAWLGGKLIQGAFPNMSADDREGLISGTCSECWESDIGEVD